MTLLPDDCVAARAMVSDYIDDELAPTEAWLLEAHVGECANCPSLYRSMVAVKQALAGCSDAGMTRVDGAELRQRVLHGLASGTRTSLLDRVRWRGRR
jgi:predicted anti-sigma-YlaC factor YlaD